MTDPQHPPDTLEDFDTRIAAAEAARDWPLVIAEIQAKWERVQAERLAAAVPEPERDFDAEVAAAEEQRDGAALIQIEMERAGMR